MLYQKELKQSGRFELIVCGGGLSGVAAAIAAARRGVRCAIVERNGFLGGVATAGLVSHLLGGMKLLSDEGRLVRNVGGIFSELSQRMIDEGAAIDPESNDFTKKYNPHGWLRGLAAGLVCDPERLKLMLEKMCREAGVELYYYTDVIDVVLKDERLTHIVIHNKSGISLLEAKYFSDNTGDADLAYLAGCPTVYGREGDALVVPASLDMVMENVDTDTLEKYIYDNDEPRFRELISKLRAEGKWDYIYDIFICVQLTRRDQYLINTIRQIKINGTDAKSMTDGTVLGREESYRLAETLKKYFPGFANARVRATAPVIGIRESRRIVGRKTVKNLDLIEGKSFDDVIGVSSYGWDMPDPLRPSFQPMQGQKRRSVFTPIPFGCMIPQGVDNLICAGRSISCEREALGALRVMAPCMAMGEAAGVAVSLDLADNRSFAKTNIALLQQELRRSGCIIDTESL